MSEYDPNLTLPQQTSDELKFISNFISLFKQSPRKIAGPHEADCELLKDQNGLIHCFNLDGLAEEIELGILTNPYIIGWVAVQASLSDLAACGATPRACHLNADFGNKNDFFMAEFTNGINAAAACFTTPIYINNINSKSSVNYVEVIAHGTTSCRPLTRLGLKDGDLIFTTALAGRGNQLALAKILATPEATTCELNFKPIARINAGQMLAPLASCAIDSSDGLLNSCHQLAILNNIAIKITTKLKNLCDENVRVFCAANNLPTWLTLAGDFADYELVFAIQSPLDATAKSILQELSAIYVGQVCTKLTTPGLYVPDSSDKLVLFNGNEVRKIIQQYTGKWQTLVNELSNWGKNL